MNDRILERYTGKDNTQGSNYDPYPDENEVDDLGNFGFLRGSKERSAILELRKKDGNIMAVGYAWLEKVVFDPSEGITLHLARQTVRIKGRNLNAEARPTIRLFESIARHRAPWIREANEHESMTARDGDTVIEAIEW